MTKQFKLGESILGRATRGVMWLGIGSGFENGLRLLRNMILTRILLPDEFGVMAIVLAVNYALLSFTEIGIKQAVIQHENGDNQIYLNGAWWLSCFRGISLFSIAYIGIPLFVNFYNNQELLPLMRVAFLGIVFSALMSPRAFVALKKMNFKKWVLINHLGGAVGVITTISLAFVLRNIWALILGYVTETAARCVLSHLLCPFKPSFQLEKESFIALITYARRILGLPILTFIFMKTDIFVIGKFCSSKDLGLYSMAVALTQIPIQLSTMVAEVLMPTFSEMQNDFKRINESIVHLTKLLVIMGAPVLVFVTLCGKEILSIIYSQQYTAVAAPFALIFARSLIGLVSLPVIAVYFAIGRPDLHRFFVGIRALLILLLIIPCVKQWGLVGAAAAGFASIIIGYLTQVNQIRVVLGLNVAEYGKIFSYAICSFALGLVAWYGIGSIFQSFSFANLFAGFIGSLCTFAALVLIYLRPEKELRSSRVVFSKRT